MDLHPRPSFFRYVHVDFSLGGGFAHVVDNVVDFPKDFVQHVMAGMCELTILDRAYSCREEPLGACQMHWVVDRSTYACIWFDR